VAANQGDDDAMATWNELRRRCRVLALATASELGSWSAPLFFAPLDLEEPRGSRARKSGWRLVFVTSPSSRHGRDLAHDPRLSAALWLAPRSIGELRGVQLIGRARPVDRDQEPAARAAFLVRHPAAAARLDRSARERLYVLEIERLKVTDNRRGFGWKRSLRRPGQPAKSSNSPGT
jgi:uncharacterized protein YhbP (UPF0306 family)